MSTPKRRRLGLRNSLRPTQILKKAIHNSPINKTPVHSRDTSIVNETCESPPLPSNQVEYLCDSESSIVNDIPCTPGVLDSFLLKDIENWDSFIVGKGDKCNKENIPECDDTINSVISPAEPKSEINHDTNTVLTARCEKIFREEIEKSFNVLNESIVKIDCNNDDNALFETNDSFLLDIRESGIIADQVNSKVEETKLAISDVNDSNSFYGLPLIVKGLFKTYRKIEKLYDWQEECLSLKAIKERRNLIYALPTSGGKTLVAEVLMLREVINRRKNALFILPFVAIVQEKIWSLAPFALQLEFLVEEYAGGKGLIPPKKRRKKNSIYVATIEKGLGLLRSLIELNRLDEIGLIVVDELHLIGESGRGSTLETLLTTVIFANKSIQIVGMSATIGNLPDITKFLNADVFEKQFRPVELTEYVKLGNTLYKMVWQNGLEIVPDRELNFDYPAAYSTLDPDLLGGLVAEVVPHSSCLIFCPTKRNCENVAALLCTVQKKEMSVHRSAERESLCSALRAEGAGGAGGAGGQLLRCVRRGVAYHHAGLGADERALLEHAFRCGVVSALCCTSTLAAGVNLPARRVLVRAPRLARARLSLAAYRQMVGRAGRAGICSAGESVLICSPREWGEVRGVLGAGLAPARSRLAPCAAELLLSAVALRLATCAPQLLALLRRSFLAVAPQDSSVSIEQVCDESIQSLLRGGALQLVSSSSGAEELAVSALGNAAVKGCMQLTVAKQFLQEVEEAEKGLVLTGSGSLHLLYLITPRDNVLRADYRLFYSLYSALDEEGAQTARRLGLTEHSAVRMVTGKPITNVPESTLCRFFLALMLRDLLMQVPFPVVAEKYNLGRGTVQAALAAAAARSGAAHALCEALQLRAFAALYAELTPRLRAAAAPGLEHLMELPAVKKGRAMQLFRAGFRRVEDVARASAERLQRLLPHLAPAAAQHLVAAAKIMLIEKVENLRAEAEDVMEGLDL